MDIKAAAATTTEAEEEVHGVVIVGGGLCGLATALALHRKGIGSLVLERSEALRVGGVALNVHANGWRALEELGVADDLRSTANLLTSFRKVRLNRNKNETTVQPASKEIRCLRRKDVLEALAKNVPPGTIRYGCHIVAIDQDPTSNCTLLTTVDDKTIKAKVVIGCDGWNSVVAKHLGLSSLSQLPLFDVLGFTSYPEGHPFGTEILHIMGDDLDVGRIPVNENLVHFFLSRSIPDYSTGMDIDETTTTEYIQEKLEEFPDEVEMVRRCDPASRWTVTKVWYRPPWQVALSSFRRGAVTVAGDAVHAMGPFIGQGGSAGLEDAVVLARSLSRAAVQLGGGAVTTMAGDSRRRCDHSLLHDDKVGTAIEEYIAARRLRVTMLSLHNFTIGTLLTTRSLALKLVCVAVLALLGDDSRRDVNYDCGRL